MAKGKHRKRRRLGTMVRSNSFVDDLVNENSGSLRRLQSLSASVSISSELVSRHGCRDGPSGTGPRK